MRRFTIRSAIASAIGAAAILLAGTNGILAQKREGTGTKSNGGTSTSSGTIHNFEQSSSASWANFAWLEGRWQGSWGPRLAEQVWMAPKAGEMAGVFREVEDHKTLVLELFSLVETSDGIEYRSLHFAPSLAPWEQSGPTILKLTAGDPNQLVFENAAGGKPRRVLLTRTGPDAYVSRSEIVPERGDTQVVEITFHRQGVSGGSAARR